MASNRDTIGIYLACRVALNVLVAFENSRDRTRYRQLLVGGDDANRDTGDPGRDQWGIFGIACSVQIDAEEAEAIANPGTDFRCVFTYSPENTNWSSPPIVAENAPIHLRI